MMKALIFVFLSLAACFAINAQSLPVDAYNLEDFYRIRQLRGENDSTISFMVRPLALSSIRFDSLYTVNDTTGRELAKSSDGWKILPFTWQNQFNSHHPYGWNDGAMVPAKGIQTFLSGGFYLESGNFSFQVKPELVFAANPSFEEFPQDHYSIIWKFYYNFYNRTDLPVRFGSEARTRIYAGQSSARYNYKKMSVGISTENLWWGPGTRNSLLMSNTAPGFPHLTLNTLSPVKTPIGSIEGQLIAARLGGSGATPPDPRHMHQGTTLYLPKSGDWRYLSGIITTLQPDVLPGLFLGFSRTSQLYSKDLNSIGDYLPFFKSFNNNVLASRPNNPDRYTSVFMRWLMAKSKAEIYFEYGHNDQLRSFTDFVKDPNQGRAYIFGLGKFFDLSKANEGIMARLEFTQLSQTSLNSVRNAQSWYVDDYVNHGYTHIGQPLGAGPGPGAEVQTLDVNWLKGIKSLGLRLERFVHNQDFYYYAYEPSLDYRRHWTDLSAEIKVRWDYKDLIFNAGINFTRSLNYGWYLSPELTDEYFVNGRDVSNLGVSFGLTYRFFKK